MIRFWGNVYAFVFREDRQKHIKDLIEEADLIRRPLMVPVNWFKLDCKDVLALEDGSKAFIMHRYRVTFMMGTEDQFNNASFPRDTCILKEQ